MCIYTVTRKCDGVGLEKAKFLIQVPRYLRTLSSPSCVELTIGEIVQVSRMQSSRIEEAERSESFWLSTIDSFGEQSRVEERCIPGDLKFMGRKNLSVGSCYLICLTVGTGG